MFLDAGWEWEVVRNLSGLDLFGWFLRLRNSPYLCTVKIEKYSLIYQPTKTSLMKRLTNILASFIMNKNISARHFLWCLLTALTAAALTACSGSSRSGVAIDTAPQTFCVALDLSDRIADNQQVEMDKFAVLQVFAIFEERAKTMRYINSTDKFMVAVIPQSGMDPRVGDLATLLSLDLSSIPMQEKNHKVKELRKRLPDTLDEIYSIAHRPSMEQYSGADVWRFFNDYIPERMKASEQFKLVMVSDGYIELDNSNETFSRSGQVNHMSKRLMASLREGDRWMNSDCDVLLLPERLKRHDLSRMEFVLLGLRTRNPYPYETSLVEKVWTNWLERMKVGSARIIPYEGCDSRLIGRSLTEALL